MVVQVVCYLHQLLGPLAQCLKEVIENARTERIQTVAMPASVCARFVDTLMGPISAISRLIRRRRVAVQQSATSFELSKSPRASVLPNARAVLIILHLA